tara:strand:- start:161 stop:358 length:198 start_codon:yes stop_codon:yes gene_type:complete
MHTGGTRRRNRNPRINQMIDRVSLTGAGGTLATIGIGQVNSVVGIVVGVLTCVYLTIKIAQLIGK